MRRTAPTASPAGGAAGPGTSRTGARMRRPIFALAATAAITLAACGDPSTEEDPAVTDPPTTQPAGTDPGMSDPALTPAALDGRTFVATASAGFELVDGTRTTLGFTGDGAAATVGANAGCNHLGGTYSLDAAGPGSGILVVTGLSQTEMGCEPQLMDQDARLGALLMAAPRLDLDGNTLVLGTSDGRTITFTDREVVDPDRPLEGTAWTLTSIVAGDVASSVPAGVVATLAITDGRAAVAAGCNSGSAPVTVAADGTSIEFGPLALTRMACADEAMAVESAVGAVLTGTVTASITADVLTLTSADGSAGLQYTAGA